MAGYSKRKKITLTGGASGAQTDFQLELTVTYDGDMQSDFDDLRFTQADGTTLIDAWLETKTDDISATVWAEFPTTPANTVDADYYMYYGNAGAASDWDGAATFAMFDDFESYANTAAMLAVWSVLYGNPTLETTIVYEGSKGLDVVPLSWMKRNLPLTSNFEVVVWGRYGAMTDDYGLMIRESDADTVVMMSGGYPTANNWGYRIDANSGGTNTGIAQAGIDTWQKMTLRLSESKISFWENDTLVVNEVAYTRVPYEIVLGRENTYQDLLYIYKKVANPPTYAFGSEESEAIELSAIIATVTAVSASDLNILRPLASTIATVTLLSEIELLTGEIRELVATIAASTSTSTSDLNILRELIASIDTTTSLSDIELLAGVLRELEAIIEATTALTTIELMITMWLTSNPTITRLKSEGWFE